jgi:cobalt-zinc-cadmium efflux system membrane fusion protein
MEREKETAMDQARERNDNGESTNHDGSGTGPTTPSSGPTPGAAPGRRGLIVGVCAVAVVGIIAFAILRKGKAEHAAEDVPGLRAESGVLVASEGVAELRYVDVAVANLADPVAPLPAPGRVMVAESRSTPIMAPLSGRIEQVTVQPGDTVKAGDKLIAVRSAVLPELGRDIETATAALAVKKASAARVRDLVNLRAVPEKDLLLAEEELREAEIALRSAEGKRRSFRLGALDHGGLFWLEAPRAGTVVDRHALVGMEVGPDHGEALLSIAMLDEVVVIADLLETDVAGVKPGQKAIVTPANAADRPLPGTVEYVAAVVDPVRRTVAVRVRVPNPGHELRPNAFAQVSFVEADTTHKIVVPTEAVVTDGQKSVIFVREEKRPGEYRFIRREVKAGRSRDGKTEILEGLKAGETFVAHGALLLLNTLDLEG